MARSQLGLRISLELRQGLEARAQIEQRTITSLLERYIGEGLARDRNELIEQGMAPLIKEAVEEAVKEGINWGLGAVYKRLWDDLQPVLNAQADQVMLATRNTAVTRQLVYNLLGREVEETVLQEMYSLALSQAEKEGQQ